MTCSTCTASVIGSFELQFVHGLFQTEAYARSVTELGNKAASETHLVGVATTPRFTIQVVPSARGGHAAAGGSFTILRFAEPEVP
jgi:hypothetical protein